MDLRDQLKDLFPEHKALEQQPPASKPDFWLQDGPLICKYEKRKGKPITILEGYTGTETDFKIIGQGTELNYEMLNVVDDITYEVRAKAINTLGISSLRAC